MRWTRYVRTSALAAAMAISSASFAQSHPEYIPLGRLSAALYKPDSGPAPHVAFILAHRTGNYLNHIGCRELSARGFLVLCFNTRFQNNEASVRWEETALDVKAAVDFARSQPGITKVILFGHSGGGPLMSFYQALAEKGPAYCQAPNKLVKCGSDLNGLKPADGIVFADAHPGNPVQALRNLNPSVTIKGGKRRVDPALDPFDPKNGFNPNGPSHYSKEFQDRYFAAQAARMNALIDAALSAQARMKSGDYPYPDDDIVIIPSGGNPGAGAGGDAALATLDPSIADMMNTARPEKLLRNDGSIETEIVHSVAVSVPEMAVTNRTFDAGTKLFTIKSFLSANATRATNARDGIDYCSSNNSTTCAVQSISVPIMIAAMGGYHFIRDDEIIVEKSASKDKDYVVIEGALHGFRPCTACEKTKGQYSNTVKNLFDYIRDWTNKRF
jgi:pimeloyl-ACP methyl ester carboxylesterase